MAEYDGWCAAAGLELESRFASWDEEPFDPEATYAVSVHRWPEPAAPTGSGPDARDHAVEHAEPPDEPVDDYFSG